MRSSSKPATRERVGDRHFQRRRGTQARADRHVGRDRQVGALELPPARREFDRDADDIIAPLAPPLRRLAVEIELDALVESE